MNSCPSLICNVFIFCVFAVLLRVPIYKDITEKV